MYCRKCGAEVPAGAQFCAKCGTKVIDVPPSDGVINHSDTASKPLVDIAKGVNVGAIQVVEGALSAILAVLALFAPVVRVIYDTGYSTSSMLHVALNLSRFRFPGKYAPIGPILGILMVLACVGSLLNAKQAFANELPKPQSIAGGISVSNSYASMITIYAIALIILLGIAGGNAYGIAGCSGWAWFLLFGGITCQVIHFVRWSLNAPRVR